MSRTRWLAVEWGLSLKQLANSLRTEQFTNKSAEGFVIDRVRRDSIEARYVQRVESTEVVVDPFGREASYDRVIFNEQPFLAATSYPGLQLSNGPRSLQSFYAALSRTTDFRFSAKQINVNVYAWLRACEKLLPGVLSVDAVQVGGISLRGSATARALVKAVSGGDARDALEELLDGRQHVIEKVRLRVKKAKGSVVLSANCSAAVTGIAPHDEQLLNEKFREALENILRAS